jgi:hypothetical protein
MLSFLCSMNNWSVLIYILVIHILRLRIDPPLKENS